MTIYRVLGVPPSFSAGCVICREPISDLAQATLVRREAHNRFQTAHAACAQGAWVEGPPNAGRTWSGPREVSVLDVAPSVPVVGSTDPGTPIVHLSLADARDAVALMADMSQFMMALQDYQRFNGVSIAFHRAITLATRPITRADHDHVRVGALLHVRGTGADLLGVYVGSTPDGVGAWIAWTHPDAWDAQGHPVVELVPWDDLEPVPLAGSGPEVSR